MSTARRIDFVEDTNLTDEAQTFNKPYQTVDRPLVTDRDIHEEYMKDPPKNQPYKFDTGSRSRGLQEGAQEDINPKQEGILGDETLGRRLKSEILEEMTTESSVHPGNPSI